jgi:hypothetical protein
VWNASGGRIAWSGAALSYGLATACGKVASQPDGAAKAAAVVTAGPSSICRGDILRPSAVPPAEGLWSVQTTDTRGRRARVAVMLGPTELRGGSTLVTRSLEAIETGPQGQELRSRVDTAAVHVDLLPSYADAASRVAGGAPLATEPAATYTISPRVLIAAYESCLDAGDPAIRYLRRDERGRIAVDAMLRREAEPRRE